MLHPSLIEARLGELSFTASRWFKAEINELQHILMEDEKIISLVCGRYFGSFALLVATDQRLLLIDKRVFFMNIEDTRYDMISEIDYNSQVVYSATVTIFTMNKTHKFTSIKYKKQLRELTNYVQQRVREFRQQEPQVQSNSAPLVHQAQAYRPAPAAAAFSNNPAPAAPPVDYYAANSQSDGHHVRVRQIGHVAHLIGSAATRAAHRHAYAVRPRRPPVNPYIQGSLVTRRPVGTSTTSEY